MRKNVLCTMALLAGVGSVMDTRSVSAANRYWAGGLGLWQTSNWTDTEGGGIFFGPPNPAERCRYPRSVNHHSVSMEPLQLSPTEQPPAPVV